MSGFQESISNMDELPPEIDPNFEPQPRSRCHTWPSRPTEFSLPPQDGETESNCSPSAASESDAGEIKAHDATGLKQNNNKSNSRRNAWGNLSYADLITKAIQSSPDQRLTLSQIYDWMVQNVPYFKDKGDSNSSAGWKNSIRHNLSLHNRFMRIQNEGTGKSSWWVINPDAKPGFTKHKPRHTLMDEFGIAKGKSPRRRATSMDTKAYEKKRGRAKKKVDQLRAALEAGHSPSSPISETGDYSPLPSFTLSPSDFRPRASSNASSCGRLSPIPAIEPDLHDSQVPSMSPIPWGNDGMGSCGNLSYNSDYTDLTENFGDVMTLGELPYKDSLGPLSEVRSMGSNSSIPQMLSSYDTYSTGNEYDFSMPPPPYPSNPSPNVLQQQQQQQQQVTTNGNTGNTYINLTSPQVQDMYSQEALVRQDPMMSNTLSNSVTAFRTINGVSQSRMSGGSVVASSVYQNGRGMSPVQQARPQQPVSDSLLRAALTQNTQKQAPSYASAQAPTIQINMYSQLNTNNMQPMNYGMMNSGGGGGLNCFPSDLDFTLDALQPEGLECDVNQVIQHELSVDGNLDFAFDPSTPSHNVVR